MRYHINNSMIQKRMRSVCSTLENADCMKYFDRAVKENTIDMNNASKFLLECASTNNADRYYRNCLTLIESQTDAVKSTMLTDKFVNNVLPYISNIKGVLEAVSDYNLSVPQIKTITEAANRYKNCDRIIKNHAILQEHFDLDTFSSSTKLPKKIIKKCCDVVCEMADEYKINEIFSIALDESSYILQKSGIKYKQKDMVQFVTEYFLMKNKIDKSDRASIKNVLKTNCMIEDVDLANVRYFVTGTDKVKSSMIRLIHKFINNIDREIIPDFMELCKAATSAYVVPKEDFVMNLGFLFDFTQTYLISDEYNTKEVIEAIDIIPDRIQEQMMNDTWRFTRSDLDNIINHYQMAIINIDKEFTSYNEEDYTKAQQLDLLKSTYEFAIKSINNLRNFIYTDYNINNMNEMAILVENSHPYYLSEFKMFKFDTLLKAAGEVEKMIKSRGKALFGKIGNKLKLIKRKKPLKDITVDEAFTVRETCDVCACSWQIIDDTNLWECHDILSNICKGLNENNLRNSTIRAYYVAKPNIFELRLEDTATLLLTDEEKVQLEDGLPVEDKFRILDLEECANVLEEFSNANVDGLVSAIKEAKVNRSTMDSIVEAAKYIDCITKEDVESFYEGNLTYWSHIDNVPIEIQTEATNLIYAMLESEEEKEKINKDKANVENKKSLGDKIKEKFSSNKNDKDKTEEGDKPKKNPFAGVNLNSLKLYVKGLQAKFKNMTNKEKEWSRTVDMHFNKLYKGCKDALISDRREAIIKGSIIPSFSKCIKLAAGLAGITFINPAAAAITAVGGLAASKALTHKERLLLLDDIEVELEMLDKEIEMAESKKQMKKLRALMKTKKDLQRQYQRIKYNIRIGKDILPGSTVGLKNTDN